MPSIIEYLNRRSREVTAVVDQTFFRLMEGTSAIEEAIPLTNYNSREILIAKMSHRKMPIAQILAPGEEVKATRPQMTIVEVLNRNVKLGQKIIWTERDFDLMNNMSNQIAASGPAAANLKQALDEYFFGAVTSLVPSVYEKSLMLSLRLACIGQCNFTDPISGYQVAIDVAPPAGQIATTLTGNARWSQPATCTPLANLEAHAKAYYTLLGKWPNAVKMHFDNLRQIAESAEAKLAWHRREGGSGTAAAELYLTDEMTVSLIKERVRCQSVDLFDAQYTSEDAAGVQTDSYFLPPDYYLFTQPGYIERAFVPTVERDFQPGLYQISDVQSKLPRVEYSAIAGAFVPYVKDERYIAARNVNNTAIS